MSSRSDSQARPAPGTENRVKQDVNPSGKPGKPSGGGNSRGGRRRDGGKGLEPPWKPRYTQPRDGGFRGDKKPPPRGGWRGGPGHAGGQGRGPMMEDEVGSLYAPGSKKQSLNHLLNFQYGPPRGNNQQHGGRRGGRDRWEGGGNYRSEANQRRKPVARPRYKKEHYLQANCQFIVKSAGDYSVHAVDPDILVNWDLIEQVNLKISGAAASCPICLYPPVAAKTPRCGHVFCWACILHYLALSDDDWRKCPICDESIQKQDLKSAVSIPQVDFGTGAEIEMQLMKRERNSLSAVPVGCKAVHTFPSMDGGTSFTKLLLASPQEVSRSILARERRELEKQWMEEKDQPESCFIQEALKMLVQREESALCAPVFQDVVAPTSKVSSPVEELPPIEALKITNAVDQVDPFADDLDNLDDMIELSEDGTNTSVGMELGNSRHRSPSGSSDGSSGVEELGAEVDTIITAEDLDISGVQPREENKNGNGGSNGKPGPKTTFYFYQSLDGQPIFLHALNVQMLVEEFGTLEACPPIIKAAILEKDATAMTEELRDRLRYLRHLPVASAFEVAELDLKPPMVSKKTMGIFKAQVEKRRRNRAKRNRDEKRREKRIEAEEDRKLGFSGKAVRIESSFGKESENVMTENPPLTVEDPGLSRQRNVSMGSDVSTGSSMAMSTGSSMAVDNNNTPSFAKMLKDGAARKAVPPPAPKPTTGVLGVMVPLLPRRARTHSDSEPEPEEWVPPPPVASLGDTLAAALQNASATNGGDKEGEGGKKKKKGKRGKQILLTSSARPIM